MAISPAGIRRTEKKPVSRDMARETIRTGGMSILRLIPQVFMTRISRSLLKREKATITPAILAMGIMYKSIFGKIYAKRRIKSAKPIPRLRTISSMGTRRTRKNTPYRIRKQAKKGASSSVAI